MSGVLQIEHSAEPCGGAERAFRCAVDAFFLLIELVSDLERRCLARRSPWRWATSRFVISGVRLLRR